MTHATGDSPFRQEDPLARIEALRGQRAALVEELTATKGEMAVLHAWSWSRFVVGLLLLPLGAALLLLTAYLALVH